MFAWIAFFINVWATLSIGAQVEAAHGVVWGLGAAIGVFFVGCVITAIISRAEEAGGLWG